MLNPKFAKYIEGFREVYKKELNVEPVMKDYVFNGWFDVKDKKFINFYKIGKKHARRIVDGIKKEQA